MDRFLVGGEATASYRRDRWSARPLVEERSVLQALTKYEVAHQNKFSGRPKRVLDEDEIPECNCHRGRDWSVTCGIGCENRSIQVECVRGSCSTGGHCSNQQMQDGSNALLSVKKAPDKGIALLTCQQFLPDVGRRLAASDATLANHYRVGRSASNLEVGRCGRAGQTLRSIVGHKFSIRW
ncbi:hypothetical protein Pcac1_g12453 [Phytophthora cactorum]|nr:hypothetical protein Pcac1_g12453 [Phytophthora cactorum]